MRTRKKKKQRKSASTRTNVSVASSGHRRFRHQMPRQAEDAFNQLPNLSRYVDARSGRQYVFLCLDGPNLLIESLCGIQPTDADDQTDVRRQPKLPVNVRAASCRQVASDAPTGSAIRPTPGSLSPPPADRRR
jgi:hypothetical protein